LLLEFFHGSSIAIMQNLFVTKFSRHVPKKKRSQIFKITGKC